MAKKPDQNGKQPSGEDAKSKSKGMSSWMKMSMFVAILSIIASWPKILMFMGLSKEEIKEQFGINSAYTKALEDIYENFNISSKTSSSGTLLPNWDDMISMINGSIANKPTTEKTTRSGYRLAQSGAKAKYPVVMIPGFITSGLEVWSGEECMQQHFRTRIWGSLNMAQKIIENKDCWIRHLTLHPETGMDPSPDIRIRAAQGFEAADYFISNYWVLGKLIENLADVGYDGTNMAMFAYDWRLAFPLIEKRDGYLTKLKLTIEGLVKTTGEKAVILNHSMGSPTTLFFLRWVTTDEKHGGGGGGSDWVHKYIHSVVNMAGATLGAPKAVSALLSGEMKETSQILGVAADVLEKYFSRKKRIDLFHSWGSLWALLPKGGNAIWGAAADVEEAAIIPGDDHGSYQVSPMITLTGEAGISGKCPNVSTSLLETDEASVSLLRSTIEEFAKLKHVSTDEIVSFLKNWGGGHGPALMSSIIHHFGSGNEEEEVLPIEKWHDPTVTPLPHAPDLKMYCLYGMGVPTERAYHYNRQKYMSVSGNSDDLDVASTAEDGSCSDSFQFAEPPFILDTDTNIKQEGSESGMIENGVYVSDGDGSVPLISMGYMCADGWIDSPLNPSKMEVITREYLERAEFDIKDPLRYGSHSGQHCDILGNVEFLDDVIKIVTDFEPVSSHIISDIENIAKRINEHPFGGIKGKTQR